MSKVYRCDSCELRTTDPFVIRGRTLCAICADEEDHRIVESRMNFNQAREYDSRFGVQLRRPAHEHRD